MYYFNPDTIEYFHSRSFEIFDAEELYEEIDNKIIDWYHNELISAIQLQHYWCHPPVVEQGSHNGRIQSMIDDKKYGYIRQFTWKISRLYKHKIRPLFGNRKK